MPAPTDSDETNHGGRRAKDRRNAQLPFDSIERRKGERRSGDDRRCNPRITTN